MSERMSAADVSFLFRETRTTPQHVGGIAVFEPPPDGFDYDRLLRLLEERISLVPRYRQKVRPIPGNLSYPLWVDDPQFDITYHVRRSALPRPGTEAQLLEFAARIQSRVLDRNRPLWEIYLVEGLTHDRIAIVTKTHEAMIDGAGAVDMLQVILDASPEPRSSLEPIWMPDPEPTGRALVTAAVTDVARRPITILETARVGGQDVRAVAGRIGAALVDAATSAVANVRRAAPKPLAAKLGEQRRIAVARTKLDDYRSVRHAHNASVNDVVLATISGALRTWLLERGTEITPAMTIRALVPLSVTDDAALESGSETSVGAALHSRVKAFLVDLPVGEPDPKHRLAQLGYALAEHKTSGHSVSADALVGLAGFAPPTLHAVGARAANGFARRAFSLVITNVPGPQQPLYAAGARLVEMYPVVPLNAGQPLTIALTSYDGDVYFGINADRDAVPDVAVIADGITTSLADLMASVPTPRVTSRATRIWERSR